MNISILPASSREKIWFFFEYSQSRLAVAFRVFIGILIVFSAGTAVVEFLHPHFLKNFSQEVIYFEYAVLAVFTFEYLARFLSAPKKFKFLVNTYNIIDFLAIAPFYLSIGNPAALRVLRIFRLLRILRLLKLLRVYNAFRFKDTIIQKVTPLVLLFIAIKIPLIYLESIGYWFTVSELGFLFTIIGFALGVVLSSKVAITYEKYITIENSLFHLQGKLSSMMFNLNSFNGSGTPLVSRWMRGFLNLYRGPDKKSMRNLLRLNEELYEGVKKLGNSDLIPHHRLAALLKEIFEESTFILGRKTTYVPEAYDRLLQQVLLIYLFLIVLFIAGFQGLIAAILGTYLLYGMYYVTRDLDLSDEKLSLIKLDPQRLEAFYQELESKQIKR